MSKDELKQISGIVLAAGTAKRMRSVKLLLELDSEPLVRRAVRASIDAGLQPVVVVLGDNAEEIRAAIEGLDCRPVINADYQTGMASSIARGLAELPEEVLGAVVSLADMPFVTSDMLRRVRELAAEAQDKVRAIRSSYGGVVAPPTYFHRHLFPKLLEGHGDEGGKQILEESSTPEEEVSWPKEALFDIDTVGDYELARRLLGGT